MGRVAHKRDKRRTFTKAERAIVWHKCNGHCAYCGTLLPDKGWHVDHIHPHRRGGSNAMANLHPACWPCNNLKHTLSLEQFRKRIAAQLDRARKYSVNFRTAERFGLITVTASHKVKFYFETISPVPKGGEQT